MIGVEPTISWSRTRRDTASLHLDRIGLKFPFQNKEDNYLDVVLCNLCSVSFSVDLSLERFELEHLRSSYYKIRFFASESSSSRFIYLLFLTPPQAVEVISFSGTFFDDSWKMLLYPFPGLLDLNFCDEIVRSLLSSRNLILGSFKACLPSLRRFP